MKTVSQILSETNEATWKEAEHFPSPLAALSYQDLSHVTRGISTECGEIVDAVKRHLDYDQYLDIENLEEEIGDLLYYVNKLATMYGITLESAAASNQSKLRVRYPDGFSVKSAVERADKQ